MSVASATAVQLPFLGLHRFDEEHEPLFFGREEQIHDVLDKVAGTRFVAVIGSSGSGKSSLVRAGVIPALRAGFLTVAGSSWRIAKCNPGNAPIRNLAGELERVFDASGIEITLRRGPLGLIESARQAGIGPAENLLVMVDQFEEIFHYQRDARDRPAAVEEATAFVKLLLEATAQDRLSIYALVTMRSEYLGACAQFRDLPERINAGLYLVPRMRRDQLEEAITGPAAVAGAQFSPPLVQRLLNDAGEDPDQLPVLQHALRRTWIHWKNGGDKPRPIEFRDYEAGGGVREGLDTHAEEIYGQLGPADQKTAEMMFRCLSERDPSNNDIRRPTELGVMAAIVGAPTADVRRIADRFRADDVAFLMPPSAVPLDDRTELDITHESLIRKWHRLGGTRERKGWVQAEAELRDQYRDLVKTARRALPSGAVLTGSDLTAALDWRALNPKPEWGVRYERDPDAFALVSDYIERSNARRRSQEKRRKLYLLLGAGGLTLIVGLVSALLQNRTTNARLQELQSLATARQLASQADGLAERDSQAEVRALLAIESLNQKALPEGLMAIREPLAVLAKPLWAKQTARPKASPATSDQDVEEDSPSSLRFSPDGRYVAALTGAADLRVYVATSGAEIALPTLARRPTSIAWSGDRLYATTISRGDQEPPAVGEPDVTRVISIQPGLPEVRQVRDAPCGNGCSLSPDARYLVVHGDAKDGSSLLPVASGAPVDVAGGIYGVGPDARLVLVEMKTAEVNTVRLRDRQLHRDSKIAFDAVHAVFDLGSPSGVVATRDRNQEIRIYQTRPRTEETAQVRSSSDPNQVALSPDGQLLAIGDDEGGVRIVDWATKRKLAVWGHLTGIAAITFSPDGQSVSSIDAAGELRLVRLPERALTFGAGIRSMGASFEGQDRYLLIRRPMIRAELFDVATRSQIMLAGGYATLISVSPDGRFAAAARPDRTAEVAELPDGAATAFGPPPGRVSSLSLSPGGRYIALRAGSRLLIMDRSTGRSIALPATVSEGASSPVFSPDGRFLAVRAVKSSEIVLVLCGSWEVVGKWKMQGTVFTSTFSPDGRFLTARGLGPRRDSEDEERHPTTRRFLLIDTGTLEAVKLGVPEDVTVSATRFSPDSHWFAVATADRDRAAQVFELPSMRRVVRWPTDSSVSSLAFSRSARYLAIGGSNAAPRIYELPGGSEISRIALRANERLAAMRFSDDEQALLVASRLDIETPGITLTTHLLFRQGLIREACRRVTRNLRPEGEWHRYLPELPYRPTCEGLPIPTE